MIGRLLTIAGQISFWTLAIAGAAALVIGAAALVASDDDPDSIEALIDATREEHPLFADWDIRELTP